jgi:outer membrane receptor protein involved in Fe transport
MRSADPTFEWEGKVRGEMGSQDKRVGSVAISGPLVDDVLAFRFAADYQTHDSDVEFTPYAEVAKPNLYRNETVRGKLLFTPNDRIRSLVTFGHTDGRAPQSERVKRPFSDRQAEFPNQPSFRSRNTYGIWDTSWVASDNVTFEMNMSATDFRTDRHTVTSLGNLRIDGNEHVFQPMVRLRTSDGNVSGFISAYIFRTEQDEVIDIFGGGSYRDESESNAIFGEATWWMTDAYRVTLGGRYEEEKRYRVGNAGPLFVDFDETYKEFLPKATLAWDANDDWTLGMTVGKGYNGGGAGITFSAPFVAYTYDPEYVWNYEGFLRGTLMDGKLDVTANIFYNDFEDMQLPYSLSSSSTVIRNAEKATTYGVETGAKYHFSQGNMVFVNLGLLSTKVDSYGDVTVEGNDLARAPAFSFDVGFTITPMPRLEFSTNLRYTDAYYSDATNSPRGKVDAYSVANAQMVYTVNSTRFYLTAENIFDSDSEVSVLSGATASADSATLLKPRTISAGIEYSF